MYQPLSLVTSNKFDHSFINTEQLYYFIEAACLDLEALAFQTSKSSIVRNSFIDLAGQPPRSAVQINPHMPTLGLRRMCGLATLRY